MSPPLALGQAIHDLIDSLSVLPVDKRLDISLVKRFDVIWENVTGKKGGFVNKEEEDSYKARGLEMLKRLEEHPGPILKEAIKLKESLPYYWLSDEENIILCGKIDWIEYLRGKDAVSIIDFKTGRLTEPEGSLQLPIYLLLATNIQKRKVDSVNYWYLYRENKPKKMKMPDIDDSYEKIFKIAKRIKLARQIDHFKCPTNGCSGCIPLEDIVKGRGERVGISGFNQDIYILL